MGTIIKIKDANFADVKIASGIEWLDMPLAQGGLVTTNGPTQGNTNTSLYRIRSNTSYQYKLEPGQTIHIKGLKGLNGEQRPLYYCYLWYNGSANHSHFVGINSDTYVLGGEDDEMAITNNLSEPYFYHFTFCINPTNNVDPTTFTDYSPLKYYIEG